VTLTDWGREIKQKKIAFVRTTRTDTDLVGVGTVASERIEYLLVEMPTRQELIRQRLRRRVEVTADDDSTLTAAAAAAAAVH